MRARSLFFAAAVAASALVTAHVRLIHTGNGKALKWGRPQEIWIVLNATGSDDITDGSHLTALRNAIDAWNAVPNVTAHLAENTASAQMQRTDWSSDSVHLVLFDEDDSSGYFPGGSGTVALTPIWFADNGGITDADILFNGVDFEFTTSGASGAFDVQDVATHELGHFLGLDHSGWAGASMYPYVDPTVVLHRSLSSDESHGLQDAYPFLPLASIAGVIRRASNDTIVAGAHVVARDEQGRTAASALTTSLGAFTLPALAAGTYTLYAVPLDQPVSSGNLTPGHTIQTNFGATVLGAFTVAEGEALSVGARQVGADVALSLGRNYDVFPLRAVAGLTRSFQLRGTNLAAGSTLTASDPDVTVVVTSWMGSQVNFLVTVASNEPAGHVDLAVSNGAGELSILPGALEITARDPVLDSVEPLLATTSGGTLVTLRGSRFTAGSRVVLGADVYVDGEPEGCTVVDANTITLTTLPSSGGLADAVVIDASGVEARIDDALEFALVPAIGNVFPPSGSSAGGTQLTLTGSDFEAGCTVAIDGVAQRNVTRESASTLRIVTGAYTAGGPYVLEVQNPSGPVASAAFAYVAEADPAITTIDPAAGSASGGDEILVHGANFLASTSVVFGADADTGEGGTPAAAIEVLDANTLRVVTPPFASGLQSVIVRDALSGQAAVLPAAFRFRSSGGGGCSTLPASAPRDPRDAIAALGWLLALLGAFALRTRALRRCAS